MTPESVPLLKPRAAPYKAYDAGGLYLLVNQAGKYWRFDYRLDGKRKTLALGVFPDVSLAIAREERDGIRWQLLKKAKATGKPCKLTDEKGLYLFISASGGKLWRFDYRFDGKRKTLSLGAYPDVTLVKARDKRDDARALIADGVDPSHNRKAQKAAKGERAANSFEVVAREWFEDRKAGWSPSHSGRLLKRLENDVFPWLGGRPIAEIAAPEILAVMRRICAFR
ncbi:MAG: Arm DNA-binding domain-containing protein [Sulfuritalea sp.]|nr:Arm DNA-binding domain-containing protein [Sulfuritalea sp.]